jgi:phosphopantothenoylcysteine decarboxylase/phosphopantothenate--cysteine ligase
MHDTLNDKRILIGITGGIAAYKVLELIRRLKEHGAQVKVILTAGGKEFVTPLSIQALSGERVFQTLLSAENEAAMGHIELARWADVLLIAPATANCIAKCAHGITDDLLSTVYLATTAPVLIAPAMNQQMWQHTATQGNINVLKQRGVIICGPNSGNQACGEVGPGRMLEAFELLEILAMHFAPKILTNKHVLITAGPTQEAIDPVRYLSNHSSGKMGYALATAALQLGAHVTLISGPTQLSPPQNHNLNFINVTSAQDMLNAVMDAIHETKVDIFIGCAAVADYTPIEAKEQKTKKDQANLLLELRPTQDILATVAKLPAGQRPFTVGFAAETQNLLQNAEQKLHNKHLDLIIANSVAQGATFNQDENQVFILRKDAAISAWPKMRKDVLAFKLLEEIVN